MVMKLELNADGITTKLYLRIPIEIEDHEMDVTAYDYLQEYYPVTSRRLRMSEKSWSVDILRGPEQIWSTCTFYPNPDGDRALCEWLGLPEEHETPRGDVHGRGLKERIMALTDRLCTDLAEEDE